MQIFDQKIIQQAMIIIITKIIYPNNQIKINNFNSTIIKIKIYNYKKIIKH